MMLVRCARPTLSYVTVATCGTFTLRPLSSLVASKTPLDSSTTDTSSKNVDIYAAVCLIRPATLTPEKNIIEDRLMSAVSRLEVARSILSDWEVQHREDLRHAEALRSGKVDVTQDEMESSTVTAQDLYDQGEIALKEFKIASRKTSQDLAQDKSKTTNRDLDRPLFLLSHITQDTRSNDFKWLLPDAKLQKGETLRQTAERAIMDNFTLSENSKVQIIGNAPASLHRYNYPPAVRSQLGTTGRHIFIYNAYLFSGEITGLVSTAKTAEQTEARIADWQWVLSDELGQILRKDLKGWINRKYARCVMAGIFADRNVPFERVIRPFQRRLAELETRTNAMRASS